MDDRSLDLSPLLGGGGRTSGVTFFETAEPRPRRDRAWLWAYLVLLFSALGAGIFAIYNRNPAFAELVTFEHLNDPASCPVESHRRGLLQDTPEDHAKDFSVDAFLAHPVVWTGGALVGSVLLGVVFLLGVRRHAAGMVHTAISLQIMLPMTAGILAVVNGNTVPGVVMFAMGGLMCLLFWLWREQIGLVCHLLGVAGRALCDLPGLLGLSLGLQAANGLMMLPLMLCGLASITNGHVIFNPNRDAAVPPSQDEQGYPTCTGMDGKPAMCCTWEVQGWVSPYMALLGLAVTWTTLLAFEIKVFTVAGAVAQWYFAPVTEAHPPKPHPQARGVAAAHGPVRRSLGHALGPSLGSLCKSSAVLTLISYLRQLLEKARQEAGNNILWYIVAAVLSFLYDVLESITIFATVRMAMTGAAFMDAAHDVVALLKRNFLDAFGVWWLPPLILQNCAFVASLAFAGVMWGGSYLVWGAAPSGVLSSGLVAFITFLAAWGVLSFAAALLINVVQAVFVCYALDREAHTVTRQDVHEVYIKLPTVGPVVENPDGHLSYGAPSSVNRV
mmetsp:Transcript_4149/g.6836  ORF Transcript_4149/g.6836 Transcript_4149/m.6836 type:complete len:557 (-) Transcript_4149:830-2500(-)